MSGVMSANITKKRNTSEAFTDESNHGDEPRKRHRYMAWFARSLTPQLPSSSIHPPDRCESVVSSLAFQEGDSEDTQKPKLYKYKQLGPDQFRLLRLHPGKWDDPIHCSLVTDSISAPSSYEALSYTWGDAHPTHKILLSDEDPGCSFTVPRSSVARSNLYDALRHIRRDLRPLVLWIDAICIDQADTIEKSQQVRLMSTIYENAHRVLVWLGNATSSTAWAVSNVSRILNLDTLPMNILSIKSTALELATVFLHFIDSPWMSRSWVLQEICFARRTTFLRGRSELDSRDVQMAADVILTTYGNAAHGHAQLDALFQKLDLDPLYRVADLFRLTGESIESSADGLGVVGRRLSLFELITNTLYSQATDPRDKVYSLLAMATQDSSGPPITANYDLSLPQICGRVVECQIEDSQSLDILMKPWAPRVIESDAMDSGDAELVTWLAGKPSWICIAHDQPSGSRQPRGVRSSTAMSRIGPDLTGIARPFNASKRYLPGVRFKRRAHSCPPLPWQKGSLDRCPDRGFMASGDGSGIYNARAIKNNVLVAKGIELGMVTDVSSRMVDGIVSRDCLEMAGMSFSEGCEALQNKSDKLWERLWRILVADRNHEGLAAPSYFRLAFSRIFRQALRLRSIDTKEMLETGTDHKVIEFLSRVRDATQNRQMFSSSINNYQETLLGLAPRGAQVGDLIIILFGCSVPTIIRPAGGAGKDYVTIVGEAYVHGKMHGEAFHELKDKSLMERTQKFQIV